MTSLERFPFGAPVLPCGELLPDASDAFVLGAYPSAIHIRWVPPEETALNQIAALPVENEPSVFWDGSDAEARVQAWKRQYFDPAWGKATAARLNGPSGTWLRSNVLDPLRNAGVNATFVTDCLTTYRLSTGAASRLRDTYDHMVQQTTGLKPWRLFDHPSEAQIVHETLSTQAARLANQVAAARPRVIVSLGNAAARVINHLAGEDGTGTLSPDGYGRAKSITISGLRTSWVALVHPATPQIWQRRHEDWLRATGFDL